MYFTLYNPIVEHKKTACDTCTSGFSVTKSLLSLEVEHHIDGTV